MMNPASTNLGRDCRALAVAWQKTYTERLQMKIYRGWVQHKTNPLHVYCRLIDLGLSAHLSKRLGILYERHLYSSFVKGIRVRWTLLAKRLLS